MRYYRQRADCYWEMHDVDRAISDYRQIVRIDPNNKENNMCLIQALFDARRYDEVIDGEFIRTHYDFNFCFLQTRTNKYYTLSSKRIIGGKDETFCADELTLFILLYELQELFIRYETFLSLSLSLSF